MKRFYFLICFVGLLIFFQGMRANAENLSGEKTGVLRDQILASMAQQPNKHFYFKQEKKLAMLQKPLISEGELLVDGKNSVTWDIRKPYVMRYVIADKQIREVDERGERIIRTGDNPVAAALTEAMTTAFSGHWDEKASGVALTASGTRDDWQLQMVPRTSELKKIIVSIAVEGSGVDIQSVQIMESNGDSATIYLQSIVEKAR